MPSPLLVEFAAGPAGAWRVDSVKAICGQTLERSAFLSVREGPLTHDAGNPLVLWTLRGSTGNLRYANRNEVDTLANKQENLARREATCAALIPIRKTEAWWALAQDERRSIMEERSHHIAIGLDYLPGVARRLHHSRELGEPFDFLTWFEFAPDYARAFDQMLVRLRATEEWRYVEREVEIRISR